MKSPKTPTNFICILFVFIFFISSSAIMAQQKAFPTAYGGGAFASGGRGGNVYHVTNLNNDGAGSFRWAVSQPRPATIVFDVSGTIQITSSLDINGQDLTIAGQSAPEGGITFTNNQTNSQVTITFAKNIIMRYLRFRMQPKNESYGFRAYGRTGDGGNIMLDHLSLSYSGDEVFDFRGNDMENCTFQRGLIAEGKTGALFGDTDSANNGLFTFNNSFLTSLFVLTSHRTPNIAGAGRFDLINNVIYDWKYRLTLAMSGAELNHINNYYFMGSLGSYTYSYGGQPDRQYLHQVLNNLDPVTIYTKGNVIHEDATDPNSFNNWMWTMFEGGNQWVSPSVPTSQFTTTMMPLIGAAPPIMTALEASIEVPENAGANKYLNADGTFGIYRDANDTDYINIVQTDTPEAFANDGGYIVGDSYEYPNAVEKPRYLNFVASISATPINARPSNFYLSNPHIPEAFLNAKGLIGSPNIHNEIAPSGYTWLEEYLNGVDRDNQPEVVNANAGQDISICQDESVTLSASGGASYLWNTGETTASITVSPSETTTYTVTAYNTEATDSDTDNVVVTVKPMPAANAGGDVTTCQGMAVTLTATGGGSYQWNTGESTSSITVNPNSSTTYTVEVTQDGCTDTDEVIVTVNLIPSVDAGSDITINLGESTTLTATGANTYEWNTGATSSTVTVTPTTTTTYTVTGSIDAGCANTDTVTVTVIDTSISANAGSDVTICEGNSTTLTASGGAFYEWSTGETTASISVSPSSTTTYTVTVLDSSGSNPGTDDVTVNVNPLPSANAGADVSICLGSNTTLTATGGGSYQWNTGESTSSITVNPNSTTTYTVEVTQDGCTDSDEVIVTVNLIPSVDAGSDITINLGESTTLTATGANTYEWNTGATGSTVTVTPTTTTTYTVTGSIDAGCTNTDTVTVTVIDTSISANAGSDVSICEGNSTTLTASGGTFYEWSNGETTASIDVSPSSTTIYTVTVLDSSGSNPGTDDVTVNVNPLPSANAGADVSICRGSSTTLTATGGGSYQWNTGESTSSITVNPNSTTTYTVEVTQDGCTDTDEIIVTVDPIPSIDAGTDVSINLGESTTLTATGANTYEWNTGATGSTVTVTLTTTTTYTVTGSIDAGCTNTDTVTVTVIDTSISANAGSDVSICEGNSTTLTASGGTFYEWSTGETTASIDVSPSSTTIYTVTVLDSSGSNPGTDDVTVNVNPLPSANAGTDVSICLGSSVTLTATGGGSYQWNTGESTSSITVNPNSTTTYTVEVTQDGCTDTDEIIVTVDSIPSIDAGTDVSINLGESTTLTATGANTYEWNTGATGSTVTVTPTTTTTYSVTGTSNNGCTSTDMVTVTIIDTSVTVNAGPDVTICEGNNTTLTATGGATYQWSTGATTASINVSPNSTTTYSVTAFDPTGTNSDTDNVTVTVNPLPTANAGSNVSICRGSNVTLTATGGGSYLWSNGATTASITVGPNSSTTYSVEVTQNGCTDIDDVRVTVNSLPSVDAGPDVSINLGHSVTLNATGANSYDWNTGANSSSITVSPTSTTTYTVNGVSNSGCSNIDTVTVTVLRGNSNVNANAGPDKTICKGSSTTLTASGGSTYLWNTGETTASIDVSPNSTLTYSVTAFDTSRNNSDTDEVTITVDPNPIVDISNGGEVTILQGEFVTLSATGANRYEWNNGATLANIAVNPTGTTTYSVTGYVRECSDTSNVTVNVVPRVVAFAGNNQNICLNETTILTATGGDEYLWNTGETTASINVTPTEDTEYSVTVYNDLDYDTAEVMVYVDECTAIEDPEDPAAYEFLVYPNPTSGNLNIKISGVRQVSNIALFDLSGKVLIDEVISEEDGLLGFERTLDLSLYSEGIYLLRLVDNRNTITKKIVVNR